MANSVGDDVLVFFYVLPWLFAEDVGVGLYMMYKDI